jgi:Acyl-CoA dehydrogenase, C-terminal domain
MRKVHCTEFTFDAVYKCMQVVGVNSADKQHMFEKYLREAAIFPLYDAGTSGCNAGASTVTWPVLIRITSRDDPPAHESCSPVLMQSAVGMWLALISLR